LTCVCKCLSCYLVKRNALDWYCEAKPMISG
jgi:hypothetical protein